MSSFVFPKSGVVALAGAVTVRQNASGRAVFWTPFAITSISLHVSTVTSVSHSLMREMTGVVGNTKLDVSLMIRTGGGRGAAFCWALRHAKITTKTR